MNYLNSLNSFDNFKLFEWFMEINAYDKIKSSITKNKIDINQLLKSGLSPLHLAILKKDEKLLTILLDKGANVNILNSNGDAPLNYISTHCKDNKEYKCRIFEKLLQFGANCDHLDSFDSRPPLRTTFQLRKYNFFELLLKYNVNVEYQDKGGNTILHFVVVNDNANKYLLLLIKYAIDIEMKNHENKTALIVAMENNQLLQIKTLLDYGAKIDYEYLPLVQNFLNNLSMEHDYVFCSQFFYRLFKMYPLDRVFFAVPHKFSHYILEMERMWMQHQNNDLAGFSYYQILMKDINSHSTNSIYVTDKDFALFGRKGKKKMMLKYPFFGAIIDLKIKFAYLQTLRGTPSYMKLYFYLKNHQSLLPVKFIDTIIASLSFNDLENIKLTT